MYMIDWHKWLRKHPASKYLVLFYCLLRERSMLIIQNLDTKSFLAKEEHSSCTTTTTTTTSWGFHLPYLCPGLYGSTSTCTTHLNTNSPKQISATFIKYDSFLHIISCFDYKKHGNRLHYAFFHFTGNLISLMTWHWLQNVWEWILWQTDASNVNKNLFLK